MGNFSRSLTRELGKNTGKYISNKVFGTGHATPHRHIIERDERRRQREEARAYKEEQKNLERERREREKALKEAEKERQNELKLEMVKSNENEVQEHENYLSTIQSVHKSFSSKFDWLNLELEALEFDSNTEEVPAKDKEEYYRSWTNSQVEDLKKEAIKDAAVQVSNMKKIFDKYFPNLKGSFLDKSFFADDYDKINKSQEKLSKRLKKIESYRTKWFEEYMDEHQRNYEEFLKLKRYYKDLEKIIPGLATNDSNSITSAIKLFQPFEELSDYGSDISHEVRGNDIYIQFYVHDKKVIPTHDKVLMRKGLEVKEKEMPTSRRNEIYQDYVCSCMIRIAKELYQMFEKIEKVIVNASGMILNTATGNFEEQIIVSVAFTRKGLDNLNLDLIDPSDSLSNFEHNMKFSKSQGFFPVEAVTQ